MLLRFVRLEKPYNPSTRFKSIANFRGLSRKRPVKNLTGIKKSWAGRNYSGSITVRGRGGGHKRRYRPIDFRRRFTNQYSPSHYLRPAQSIDDKGKVIRLEYDPNRTAHIALLKYKNGAKVYIIAPDSIRRGTTLYSGFNA